MSARPRRGFGRLCVLLAVLALLGTGCSSTSKPPVAPSRYAGIGDPYYPTDGNRGYDVGSYAVSLHYQSGGQISATTTVSATVTADQPIFDLDLETSMVVTGVQVDGQAVRWVQRPPHELVLFPKHGITKGSPLVVVVTYHGQMGQSGPISGWHPLAGGGGVMAGEPHSCAFWYPCDDHPTDKARFSVTATVPIADQVVSNGIEGPVTRQGTDTTATSTFHWSLGTPTATYLTTIVVSPLTIDRSTLPDGTPVVSAYTPGALAERANESHLAEILAFEESRFGPYPAPTAGGIFVAAQVGFSLEVFGRPVYTAKIPFTTLVHENAHQWWGDNISVLNWRDVCFNECMASYAQWLWDEHRGENLDDYYRRTLSQVDFSAPLYDMGPGHEFDYAGVYQKGAYFEHALRRLIDASDGDAAYFGALKQIQATYGGGNMSMLQFRDVLARITHVNLTEFWKEWVLERTRPSQAMLFPGSLAG